MSAVPEQNHGRSPSNRAPLAPRSRSSRLSRADRRTRIGRVIREAERELRAEFSQDVTFAQSVLIESAAVKRGRLWLLRKQMEAGEQTSEETVNAILSLTNSLRADLVSLGLAKKRHIPKADSEPSDDDPEDDLAAHIGGRGAPRG